MPSPTTERQAHTAPTPDRAPRRSALAGALGSSRLAAADFEPIPAIDRLDVKHLATRNAEHALDRRRHVLVHPVRELDHHDGAFAGRPDKPTPYRPRALAELAKDDVHTVNLAPSSPASTCSRPTWQEIFSRHRPGDRCRWARVSSGGSAAAPPAREPKPDPGWPGWQSAERPRCCRPSRGRRAPSFVPPDFGQMPEARGLSGTPGRRTFRLSSRGPPGTSSGSGRPEAPLLAEGPRDWARVQRPGPTPASPRPPSGSCRGRSTRRTSSTLAATPAAQWFAARND